MGRGQRHSKNAGTMGSESQTYGERAALGFGTVKERLGKEAIGNYWDCKLTLQPLVDPVVTPDGYLYSKEAIYESLLAQKKANKRKLAAWEEQERGEDRKASERQAVETHTKLLAFDRQNHMGASDRAAGNIRDAIRQEAEAQLADKRVVTGAVNIRENENKIKEMKAFWLPSKAPDTRTKLEKPDLGTVCPASGKKLRLKDLIPVRFTQVPEGSSGLHMDPITHDTFSNSTQLVVLRPTGDVMLKESYDRCVEPEGHFNGMKLGKGDVIELQRGGTGFSLHDGKSIESTKYWHLGPGSGMADLRGQHQGPRSATGLIFMN
ncbi:hypothetical protein WJX84_006659 [Apatococcus fuscideae]|uniref:Nitric oxide synthase-interacting protein zinc-finger domain-containing protein n=1 Tax=Apatococcus fuscideae TaxID=2026836 RepID=A0AAW1SMP4_9CHLO